jgi:hypothetical protein
MCKGNNEPFDNNGARILEGDVPLKEGSRKVN